MAETTTKSAFTPFDVSKFEMPKFELPGFDLPKFEVPAAFREAAEKGVAQAKEGWEKMKSATEEATEVLEESYTTAAKGTSEYGLKVIDAARTNTNAGVRFRDRDCHGKVALRAGRTLDRACPQAIRHGLRADQGIDLAGPEGDRPIPSSRSRPASRAPSRRLRKSGTRRQPLLRTGCQLR